MTDIAEFFDYIRAFCNTYFVDVDISVNPESICIYMHRENTHIKRILPFSGLQSLNISYGDAIKSTLGSLLDAIDAVEG